MRLKTTQVKAFREQQLVKQGQRCCLCQDIIDPTEAVLDHDHKTGALRGVLHRGCNSLLGKIENNMPRSRVDLGRLANLSNNLIKYITGDPISEYLHPTHRTPEERKMKAKIKAQAGRGMGRGKGKKPPKR